MPEVIHADYEVSSEGGVRHWEIPYARLHDQTPTPSNPACVTGRLVGHELSGTILTIDAVRLMAMIDFTAGSVYRFDVRNVLTYAANIEDTWGVIDIGDPVYYDASATMVVGGWYLSLSPLDNAGAANSIFGYVVPANDTDMALFQKGVAGVKETISCAVMQIGAGAIV
jgi:hypothetical protein